MMKINNIEDLSDEFISSDTVGLITKSLGAACDFIAKPAGQNIAHTFYNFGNEILRILDIGTSEKEDTCYYPDEDMYLQKSNKQRRIFKGSSLEMSWLPEPNDIK